MKVHDLLQMMPQLRTMLLNNLSQPRTNTDHRTDVPGGSAIDPRLVVVNTGRNPTIVEMGILGTILTDIIVDGGSRVNVLPEETWRKLGKSTLWPSTFNMLGADQHGIKLIGIVMGQQVTIGMKPFIPDFMVIPLKKKGYDAILGRGWLVAAKATHNWNKNTLSMENGGRKFIIDLGT